MPMVPEEECVSVSDIASGKTCKEWQLFYVELMTNLPKMYLNFLSENIKAYMVYFVLNIFGGF